MAAEPQGIMGRYTVRILDANDHPAVVALYRVIQASNAGLPVLRTFSSGELLANMTTAGCMFGVFDERDLVAYATIVFGGDVARQIAAHIKGVELDPSKIAVHEGSGVHPDHRGHDLQDRLNEHRLHLAAERGVRDIVGSVSPLNPYSLKNHFDFQFLVRGYARLYGGLERVIVHRSADPIRTERCDRVIRLEDVEQHQDLFALGYVGTGIEWRDSEALLQLSARG